MSLSWKNMNWLVVAGVFTVAYGVVVGYTLGWFRISSFITADKTDLNAVGDFTAGIFAPVALLWLVAAVFTQRQELNETRDQFEENQKVVDAQLSVINRQNALLAEQHNQAVENAKKAYRLTLFDKRFQMYEKFIAFGHEYAAKDFDYAAYLGMVNLSQEAGFLFDYAVEDWLREISDQIFNYIEFKETNPPLNLAVGEFDHERNVELGKKYKSYTDWIHEQFLPTDRTARFWKFMHVSDEPYMDG